MSTADTTATKDLHADHGHGHGSGHDHAHDEHHDHPPPKWYNPLRWMMSTNHKDIGTMYIVFALFAGIIGFTFSGLMRYELAHPGLQLFDGQHGFGTEQNYNVITTMHGLIMIFFMAVSHTHLTLPTKRIV